MRNLALITMILALAVSCQSNTKKSEEAASAEIVNPVKYEIMIDGMTCTGCEATVEAGVNKLEGIKSVEANHLEGNAFVEFSDTKTDTSAIRKAITATGYKVTGFKSVIEE